MSIGFVFNSNKKPNLTGKVKLIKNKYIHVIFIYQLNAYPI